MYHRDNKDTTAADWKPGSPGDLLRIKVTASYQCDLFLVLLSRVLSEYPWGAP